MTEVQTYPIFGLFDPETPEVLSIDYGLVTEFEAGRGKRKTAEGRNVYILGVTILHELIHWGDNKDGVHRDDLPGGREAGELFEEIIYGKVIN